jgi:hypothetical protein
MTKDRSGPVWKYSRASLGNSENTDSSAAIRSGGVPILAIQLLKSIESFQAVIVGWLKIFGDAGASPL